MFDTIAAISSGNINQPISMIKVSGFDAFNIVSKIFTGRQGANKTVTYGYIKDGDEKIDEVLVLWFYEPNTFTGENMVEISAHGGMINTQRILKLILANGARLAKNGEFSQRAFLNGKIDLMKAEAIHDLIFAKTDEQAQLSIKKFDGRTSSLIDDLKTKLMNLIATIETNIDYPEYDDSEQINTTVLKPKLEQILIDIYEILDASKTSKYIYEGINVAIVGKPNSGKSSLLNELLGYDRAIVTDTPGTTRDVISGQVQIGQILFNFNDTAGIHSTRQKIEQLGIVKSLQEIQKCDLVIHLIDSTIGLSDDDVKIQQASQGKIYLKIFNKVDLTKKKGISVKDGDLKLLFSKINDQFHKINLNNDKIVYNTRQLALIDAAKNKVETALKSITIGAEPDEVIVDIRAAWIDLSNILGRAEQEDILDTIFRNFCLGK